MRLQRIERSKELTTLKLTPDNTAELPVDAVGTGNITCSVLGTSV